MLKGIVKPNGKVVSLEGVVGRLRDGIERCFRAGYLVGVNEKDEMIIYKKGEEVPVIIPPAIKVATEPGGNGEVPPGPNLHGPVELAEPEKKPGMRTSRKQARIDAQSQNRP